MASFLYAKGKEALLKGEIDVTGGAIKAQLVTNGYVPNSSTDQYFSTVTNKIDDPVALSGVSATNGVFNASSVTFTSVASGSTVYAVVLYQDSGLASTSPLLAYVDTISGFPLATSDGDIVLQWDTGANKIFAL